MNEPQRYGDTNAALTNLTVKESKVADVNHRICTVYGLSSSDKPEEIRYVGQTKANLEFRLRDHLYRAKVGDKNHRCCWIRSVIAKGLTIIISPLVDNAVWSETEIAVIAQLRASGVSLVNSTDGGDGVRNQSPESRAKIAEAGRGRKPTDRHRAVAGALMKERWKDEAWREAKRLYGVKQMLTPEAIAKRKLSRAGFKHTEEAKKKLSEASSAHHAKPGVREAISERARAAWAKPENRAKITGENAGSSKLTEDAVVAIRSAYKAGGISQQKLADRYGVGLVTINHIIKRRTWAHLE